MRATADSAALNADCLRLPVEAGPLRSDETHFLVALGRLADDVIVRCWTDESLPEIAAARSN
jgi:hypothetical protein